ncbi:TetR/AcrR family transcriptional regulator [Thalassospira profundimaris]|uniref:TetR/AcrR family transcriptional regulator n=1 Tax=Thalassospira profundimaris TaxID=502049 RepID=UPI000DEDDDFC|nr:TetR/AcrR family transcriptional regulator [Thalassospira profundimaris]
MARTQSKDYPEIREKILRSSAKVFASKGFSTSTIIDLATACNSSRGALYHYFGSKEEILSHIISEHVSQMLSELQTLGEQKLDAREFLYAVSRKIMELNAVNNAEQIVLLNDWNQLDEKQKAETAAAQRKIIAIIRDALIRLDTAHRMTPKYATTHAMSLLGSLNYTYAWYDPEGAVKPDEYADMVVNVFLDGFLSPASPG